MCKRPSPNRLFPLEKAFPAALNGEPQPNEPWRRKQGLSLAKGVPGKCFGILLFNERALNKVGE